MAKVVFLTPEIHIATGTLRVVTLWANYLSTETSHNIEIVTDTKEKPYYDFDSSVKIEQYSFDFNLKIINIPYNVIQLYRYLRSFKNKKNINIIIDKSLLIEPLWILRKLGLFKDINFIYFTHAGSSAFREFYLSRRHTKHRVGMSFEAFDKVVCLFDDERDYPNMVIRDKLYFLSNPISFEPSTIKFEEKDNTVLYLGRVELEKGVDTLLRAWSIVEHSNWRLQIVGDGKDKGEFEELARELKILESIEFLPTQKDVKYYYDKAKIFILPSLYEGMPMVILEAMSCRSTVISSDTAGGLRLIEDGKRGLLFKKGDVEELAQKITYLIKDRHQREILANHAYIYINRHNIKTVASGWSHIIQ